MSVWCAPVCACLSTFVVCEYVCVVGIYVSWMSFAHVDVLVCARACCMSVLHVFPRARMCAFLAYFVCMHVLCVSACACMFLSALFLLVCFPVFSVLVHRHVCAVCVCTCVCPVHVCARACQRLALGKPLVMLKCGRECKSPLSPGGHPRSPQVPGLRFEYVMSAMTWFMPSRSWRPRR